MPDYLHFRHCMCDVDMDQMLGPDMDRRYLAPRSVDYSPETGVSTLTLRAILPAEFRERVTALAEKERERERIRKLFNG
jgi:hypothetical protein